jgi:hypothetical protein
MDRLPDHLPERGRSRNGGSGCAYPGNPGRPSAAQKRAMIEGRARELAEGQYDRLSARDRALLLQAADLMLRPRRKREDMVRRANAVTRLLSHVRGLRSVSPSAPSFADEVLR